MQTALAKRIAMHKLVIAGLLLMIGACIVACGGGAGQSGGSHVPPTVVSGQANSDESMAAPSTPATTSQQIPGEDVRAAGLLTAKQIILPLLKSPATADFPWDTVSCQQLFYVDKVPVASLPTIDTCWRVRGRVDSQNSFGALIGSVWEIEIWHTEENYTAYRARLEGRQVYTSGPFFQLLVTTRRRLAQEATEWSTEWDASNKPVANEVDEPKKLPTPRDPEKVAASRLNLAQQLIKRGRTVAGKSRLDKLVKDFPNTKAGKKAAKLLRKLE